MLKKLLIEIIKLNFYLKEFNSTLVSEFILNKTFDIKSKKKFVWE